MKRLNGMDAMLLYSETPNLHTHTLKIAIIDGASYEQTHGAPYTFEVFRRTIARRLYLLEPLRYRLVDIPFRFHHPMWLENCDVDIDYHVRTASVPAPGGRRELDEVIGQIASTPLDRSRPLWEFYFAKGMADNRFALIGKVHHTLADGLASANLLARLMDLAGAEVTERDEYTTCSPPTRSQLLAEAGRDHLQKVAEFPGLLGEAVRGAVRVRRRAQDMRGADDMAKMFRTPPTFLNHVVSPGRTFATASVALTDVKETAKALGVTFNDLVLSVSAGGLRELLLRYDGRADRPLLASVPVATDRSPDRVTGNEISGLAVSLPVHVDDPLRRVRLTALATKRAKEIHDLMGPRLQGRMMEYLPPPVAPTAFRWQSEHAAHNRIMNVAISSVPGPRERGHIGGADVTEIYSVGVLSAASAFNMTVWSYVDQVDISVLSDDQTFDDIHEATDAMLHALTEIRRAAGLPADLRAVDSAMAPATAV
ncbi:wax ester/triacylglycerol synthase family O-acyltransferase [Mycobacterium sp. GA-2829]|uniref:WS/DGAT/MGAT family O-acyltransferase n=1 Tax=Mycobacterium sp. GA-2829 TaxID=1772283 RepID=UPI00074009C9|nr:wax ester/triacylglycerol synthase family O-acyltransferase [Mycobacterium sp. GA-2829]KUI26713.1 diacylglycerol O-acyltransferase [Mycobacterium sp. GA-2829]